jgi:hypothetical protein
MSRYLLRSWGEKCPFAIPSPASLRTAASVASGRGGWVLAHAERRVAAGWLPPHSRRQ